MSNETSRTGCPVEALSPRKEDTMTASDASEDKRAGKAARTAGPPSPPDPRDRVLDALKQAAGIVTDANPDTVADGIKNDLDKFLEGLLPAPPRPIPEDTCVNPDPQIAPFCFQLTLSRKQADIAYGGTKNAAVAALGSAIGTWSAALGEYEYSMAIADTTLRQAVKAATKAYEDKNNPDSHSRSLFLYFTMAQAVTAAIQTYEGSATSAGATLAGAAGSLLVGYQAYVDAINVARSQHLNDESTADQTFWQAVEAVRDAV
jgi:hypothetical protein